VNRLRTVVALTLFLVIAGNREARAHESRPASLDIVQEPAGSVVVVWKRPMQGDAALHLIPRLSSGWLDRDPDDLYAATDYLIATWRIPRPSVPLKGQTVSIDGLRGTITDAIVRVRFADGATQDAILRGAIPTFVVSASPAATGGGRLRYVALGISHIFNGPDHLLFVLGLVLIVSQGGRLVTTITGFTLGHTVTLIAAGLLRLNLPVPLLTLLVALSILFLGPEILRAQSGGRSITTTQPWVVAFGFGLLHGLGFATGLSGVGLRGGELVAALLQFNVGVEIAQLGWLVIVMSVINLIRVVPVRWPRPAVAAPAYAVGIAGAIWALQCATLVFTRP
jgi:hypothetical protein